MNINQLTMLCKTDPDIPQSFCDWLAANEHIWNAFVTEMRLVINAGYKHYSARTVIEYLRHHSALSEQGTAFKISNNAAPYMARLFVLLHPEHKKMFTFHGVCVAKHEKEAVDYV